MKMSVCVVCNETKIRKLLHPISDSVEALIQEHIYYGYLREVSAFPDKICSGCRSNLYFISQGKQPRSAWLEKVLKVNSLDFWMVIYNQYALRIF